MITTKLAEKEIALCLKCKLPECKDTDRDCMIRIERRERLRERRKGWACEAIPKTN